MNKKKNNKGFSLIELIIAIAILIILTGLLAPQFMKYIEKSRLAKDMQTLDTVYTAVQGAIADEGAYQDLVKKMASDGDYKGIDTEEGIPLTTLLPNTLDDDDAFGKELYALLGKNAEAINKSFQSRLAAQGTKTEDDKSTTDGEVYVSIDSKMQIVVAFGQAANDPATQGTDKLSVGSNDVPTP